MYNIIFYDTLLNFDGNGKDCSVDIHGRKSRLNGGVYNGYIVFFSF